MNTVSTGDPVFFHEADRLAAVVQDEREARQVGIGTEQGEVGVPRGRDDQVPARRHHAPAGEYKGAA